MAESEDREDHTEAPSQRRLEQAAERGDVARSAEVNTWFVLAGGALALAVAGADSAQSLARALGAMLANAHRLPEGPGGLSAYGTHSMMVALGAIGLPLAILALAGLAGGLVQHRPMFTTQPVTPQLSRISPSAGLKRVFGKEAFVQFLKGLAKLGLVSVVMAVVLWPERARLESLVTLDVAALLPATSAELSRLMTGVLAIYAFLAAGDFAWQKWTWYGRQKMTKREMKEEYKETEGHPEVKARIRKLQARASRRRMMAQVPKASVVIMNPTHYAVALQYERGMPAPRCVAKGLDALALRIRALAEENAVPVVENPPLARALYKAVDLDQDIPVEHYKAVAEVIGFVMRLRRRAT
ncbi:flagellar biosynthesis protein FlhB [Alsobacter sp. SYSU M60028]|uniref:Flagellar biosynthetic protein FlhB n=1 Tax=Alsobacter ponti TaxID=2962936 RepID=A0ABT1LFY4_9HYPH|nr:flagellar biosynthesis protein FlhB [Alsobacter ponti]MCP8940410.1 flagellar biosynthesis protein FlhB [Alsobacter ponti]